MQCPSCGFQNLPGLVQCARCTSRLALDDIDVHPCRATDRWARWRWIRHRWGRGRSLAERVNDLWYRLTHRGYWASMESPGTIPAAQRMVCVIASIVPGLGHVLAGRRCRGAWIMGGYLLALVGSLLFMSTAWTLFTAVMLGLHTYAVVDCIFYKAGYVTRLISVLTSLVVFVALALGVYRGATWLLGGFAQVEQLSANTRSVHLETDDVLLLTGRWNAPRYAPGDVVSYVIDAQGNAHGGGWYIQGGVMIDRILAGPGDRVVCKDGDLTVNGGPLPAGRGLLAHTALPAKLDLVVPQGTYFIYPTLVHVQIVRNMVESDMRLRIALVPVERIRGKVRMIVSPLSRIRVFGK